MLVLDGPADGTLTVEDVAPGRGGVVRLAAGGAVPWSPLGAGVRIDLDGLVGAIRPLALTVVGAAP